MQAVTPDDLGVYLELDTVNEDRAQMLIDDATTQALTIVTIGTVPDSGATVANLPDGAASVIRAAVARIYLNPTGVNAEAAGPYSYGRSAGTGAMFSKAERAQLRRMSGRSSAFEIDMLPTDAGSNLPPWDYSAAVVDVQTS